MSVLILIIVALIVVFAVADVRKRLISQPVFNFFKRSLPPLSETEKQAMEAGDVWWDGELFKGNPDWKTLHAYPEPKLSEEEQAFMDNQVNTLCSMLDDFKIVNDSKDLPPEVWDYIKKEGFFAFIIPKQYGGLEFSAIAASTIVSRIATRSLSAAVTIMVPNSLGPAELLLHYGTEQQKAQWLPSLASGQEVPCFALTGPEAGSDAGSIPDHGVVCEGEFNGETVLGIRLNWSKRYITLAPVASVVGLAFKLDDPDGLINDEQPGVAKHFGITCALIPANHPGVIPSQRHLPMGLAFMNGTTEGKDVFIPLDWIIGGKDYAGKGWRMLVECLSAGRGISLPALSTATGHLATKTTSAYATVRKQFGLSISQFEGIKESMARIGGLTYAMESARLLTAGAVDLKISPSIVTAIAKYHMTEMSRQVINDAFDIHAGRAIQMGPKNYLANGYVGIPISITVEGANILTRNLMIFGQGATRCHPYILKEMEAASQADQEQGLIEFDKVLTRHIAYSASNFVMSFAHAVSGSMFASAPVSGPTAKYYQQLSRFSRGLATCTDFAMLTLGGELKRKEHISARLGDVLSHLYLASATLKRYEDQGRQQADLPFVQYAVERNLFLIAQAFTELFNNFPNRPVAWVMKAVVFPLGNHYKLPKDNVVSDVCEHMCSKGVIRDRLTHLCYVGEDGPVALIEHAFQAMLNCEPLINKLNKAVKKGQLEKRLPFVEMVEKAKFLKLIDENEAELLLNAEALRKEAIAVDCFEPGFFEQQLAPNNSAAA